MAILGIGDIVDLNPGAETGLGHGTLEDLSHGAKDCGAVAGLDRGAEAEQGAMAEQKTTSG